MPSQNESNSQVALLSAKKAVSRDISCSDSQPLSHLAPPGPPSLPLTTPLTSPSTPPLLHSSPPPFSIPDSIVSSCNLSRFLLISKLLSHKQVFLDEDYTYLFIQSLITESLAFSDLR